MPEAGVIAETKALDMIADHAMGLQSREIRCAELNHGMPPK